MEDAPFNLWTAWGKGEGHSSRPPSPSPPPTPSSRGTMVCVCLLVGWTLHSESVCPLTSKSAEIWLQNKDASVSSVTIFHPTKVITWFTKLRTKTHRRHAGFMWSDPVTSQARQSIWRLNLARMERGHLISGVTSQAVRPWPIHSY